MTNYERARVYAFVIDKTPDGITDHRDLLHDSYLTWYTKNGRNLLDEPFARIAKVLKNSLRSKIAAKRVQFDKDRTYYRQYETFNDQIYNNLSPDRVVEDRLEFQQVIDGLNKRFPTTSERTLQVLRLISEGYQKKEIASKFGMSKSGISHLVNNFKKVYEQLRTS